MDEQGCTNKDPSNCTEARGGAFLYAKSDWDGRGVHSLEAESNLGMTQNSDNGNYGFTVLGVGRPGNGSVSIDGQVVATVATKDFFLGNLGLSARRVSTETLGKAAGLLTSLNDEKYIPSLSYGYTAGAAYRKMDNCTMLGRANRPQKRATRA